MDRIDLTKLFVRIIVMEMEKDKRHWPLIRAVKRILIRTLLPQQKSINALRIEFRGKIRGARRSRLIRYDITKKKIQFQTFNTRMQSASGFMNTVYGAIGIHIWIWFKNAT